MATNYPNAIDGYSEIREVVDRRDEILASDHNDLRSAIISIEQTLGQNPQGPFGTVVERLNDAYSNIEAHIAGDPPRHIDTVIDSVARTGAPYSLSIGTVGSQLTSLLSSLNSSTLYSGSGANTLADGYALPASYTTSAITEIIRRLGATAGSAAIGADAVVGSPFSLSSGSVASQTSSLLTNLNNTSLYTGGSSPYSFADSYVLDESYLSSGVTEIVRRLGSTVGAGAIGVDIGPMSVINVASPSNDIQDLLNNIDAYVDTLGNEVTTARTSPYYGAFDKLDDRIDVTDGYLNTFVSVGNTGKMYTSLTDAITDLNNANGGTIIVEPNYSFTVTTTAATHPPAIVKPIKIIALGSAIITNSKGSGADGLFKFQSGSGGSGLFGLSIVEGGTPSPTAITIDVKNITIEDCDITGQVSVANGGGITRAYFRNSDFLGSGTPSGNAAIDCYGTVTDLKVENCFISPGSESIAFRHHNGRSVQLSNCYFSAGPATAIDATGGGLTVERSSIVLTALNSTNKGIVFDSPRGSYTRNIIKDVEIYAVSSITNSVLKLSGEALAQNIKVNLGDAIGNYSGSSDQNPIQILDSAILDGLDLVGVNLPNSTDDGFEIGANEPIIMLDGSDGYNQPATLRNSIISDMDDGLSYDTGAVTIIGSVGTGGAGEAATHLKNPILIENVTVIGTGRNDNTNNLNVSYVANLPDHAVIRNCLFEGGLWAYGINAVDADHLVISGNRFNFNTSDDDRIISAIILTGNDANSPEGCSIENNEIDVYRTGASGQYIFWLNQTSGTSGDEARYNRICNNKVRVFNKTFTTMSMMVINNIRDSIIQGNMLYKGNASNVGFSFPGTEVNIVPAAASITDQNVVS